IKNEHCAHVCARCVQSACFRIYGQIFEASWLSPFSYYPFSQKLPVLIKYLDAFVNWIGDVYLTAAGINGDRSRVIELSVARAFAAPTREHVSIRAELNDSRVSLVDDIDRVIRTNGDLTRSVKAKVGSFPLGDERPIGS